MSLAKVESSKLHSALMHSCVHASGMGYIRLAADQEQRPAVRLPRERQIPARLLRVMHVHIDSMLHVRPPQRALNTAGRQALYRDCPWLRVWQSQCRGQQ